MSRFANRMSRNQYLTNRNNNFKKRHLYDNYPQGEVITEHHLKKPCSWEFPGHPVVRTQHFHCCGPKFDPWLGTKIPQSAQCSQKKRWSRVPEHRKQATGTAWQIIKLEEEGQQGKEQETERAWQTHPGGQAPDAWGQKMPHSSPEASTARTR